MTGWRDHGEAVEVAAMSPAVIRLLRGFEACRPKPCQHGGPQVAQVRDLTTMCARCASASLAFTAWSSRGPCDGCGVLPDEPPMLTWMVPNPATNTTVAIRLCAECQTDLTEPDEETTDAPTA